MFKLIEYEMNGSKTMLSSFLLWGLKQRFRMCEKKQEKGATPVVWGCSDQDGRQCRPLGRLRDFEMVFAGLQLQRLLGCFLPVYDHPNLTNAECYGVLRGVANLEGGIL